MSVTHLDDLREKLRDLRVEHRALDEKIIAMQAGYADSLEIRRLKKHKLALKETIAKLESKLIPDLNA
jgi:hypothetical protein